MSRKRLIPIAIIVAVLVLTFVFAVIFNAPGI
jgi:hypothetical protein